MKNQTVTRAWKVYGLDGHRQKVSFAPSFVDDFSKDGAARIIAVENADKTGTNDYTVIRITRNTAFESSVILYGSQTVTMYTKDKKTFESSVILYGSQTFQISSIFPTRFESSVILYGSQTVKKQCS